MITYKVVVKSRFNRAYDYSETHYQSKILAIAMAEIFSQLDTTLSVVVYEEKPQVTLDIIAEFK